MASPVPPPEFDSNFPSNVNDEKDPLRDDQFHTLRLVETKSRPHTDYMENLQKHIDPESRAQYVSWLVDAADNLGYTRRTLHLSVNCLDRYLSVNAVECDNELEIVAVACVMLASKYEQGGTGFDFEPYTRLNTCSRRDLIRMERTVWIRLDCRLTVPTTWTFLEMLVNEPESTNECMGMAGYIADISLLSYGMIRFAPSVVAASSVFLARYVLEPSRSPWSSELRKYTGYGGADLRDCVLELLSTCHSDIAKKYSPVVLQSFPPTIPPQVFNLD